jgi:hypothetical protein
MATLAASCIHLAGAATVPATHAAKSSRSMTINAMARAVLLPARGSSQARIVLRLGISPLAAATGRVGTGMDIG